jgi:histidine triad (HIT) family protein
MNDCVFCRIIKREIPTKIEKETKNLVVFRDIKPQASIHLLIVPKKHSKDITKIDDNVWVEIKNTAIDLARENKLTGFRLVNNTGKAALASHMHVHFLGEVSIDRKI